MFNTKNGSLYRKTPLLKLWMITEWVPPHVHKNRIIFRKDLNKLNNIKNDENYEKNVNEIVEDLKNREWMFIQTGDEYKKHALKYSKKVNPDFKIWLEIREERLNNIKALTYQNLLAVIKEDYILHDVTCSRYMDRPFRWMRWFAFGSFIACFFLLRICYYFYKWIQYLLLIIFLPLMLFFYALILFNRWYYHPQHKLPKWDDRVTMCQDCKRKTNLEATGLWNNYWMAMILMLIWGSEDYYWSNPKFHSEEYNRILSFDPDNKEGAIDDYVKEHYTPKEYEDWRKKGEYTKKIQKEKNETWELNKKKMSPQEFENWKKTLMTPEELERARKEFQKEFDKNRNIKKKLIWIWRLI